MPKKTRCAVCTKSIPYGQTRWLNGKTLCAACYQDAEKRAEGFRKTPQESAGASRLKEKKND